MTASLAANRRYKASSAYVVLFALISFLIAMLITGVLIGRYPQSAQFVLMLGFLFLMPYTVWSVIFWGEMYLLERWGVPVTATITEVVPMQHFIQQTSYKLTVRYRTDEMPPTHVIVWKECIAFSDPDNDDTILLTVLPYNPRVVRIGSISRSACLCMKNAYMLLLYLLYGALLLTFNLADYSSSWTGLSFVESLLLTYLIYVSTWICVVCWHWKKSRDNWQEDEDRAQPLLV